MGKTAPNIQGMIDYRKAVRRNLFRRNGRIIQILKRFGYVANHSLLLAKDRPLRKQAMPEASPIPAMAGSITGISCGRKIMPVRDSKTKDGNDHAGLEIGGRNTDGRTPTLPGEKTLGHVMCNVQVQSDDEATQKSITTKGPEYLPSY